jgi:Protein of unknown function (DUF3386)
MSQTTTNAAAHQMLQAAHNRAYRYPENFAGFKAVIGYSTDEKTYEGKVSIRSPQDIKLELDGKEDELTMLQHEIASLCGHRWYAPYSMGDGRYTLSLDENAGHPLGQLIIFQDDPFKSSYRVKDGSVVQINRQMGTTKFTIYVQEHISVEGDGKLPGQFTVAFWDTEKQRLMRNIVYTDRYTRVDGYYLPTSRRIIIYNDDGVSARIIAFSGHELF